MRYLIAFLVSLLSFASVMMAFEEPLKDAYQEQRAKEIFKSLKCEVCKGQSVLDSDSDFAKSVRTLVREKLLQGSNDEQIYDVLRSNYGEEIMFAPPMDGSTVFLWLLPFALIFTGFIIVVLVVRNSRKAVRLA